MLPVRAWSAVEWGQFTPDTYEDLSVDNTKAYMLTKLLPKHVGVRIRVDGGTPVTAGGTGELWFDTEWNYFNQIQASQLKVIADSATGATLRVTYFKGKS